MSSPLYPLLAIVRHRMGTDGSGVTSLVAGAGCPLRCRWCINRRLLSEARPEMVGPGELYDRVVIDDLYFRATGGGITFGGGESLLYPDFIRDFRSCCPKDWRISAETSLCVPEELVLQVIPHVDDFIVDCKDLDPARYRAYTGGDVCLVKENLTLLLREAGPDRIHVRVPLIPEYNTDSDQKENARILMDMGFRRIELFRYVVRDQASD